MRHARLLSSGSHDSGAPYVCRLDLGAMLHELREDRVVLLLGVPPSVDVQLDAPAVLPDRVVEAQAALAGACADPSVFARGDGGMEASAFLGQVKQAGPEPPADA